MMDEIVSISVLPLINAVELICNAILSLMLGAVVFLFIVYMGVSFIFGKKD